MLQYNYLYVTRIRTRTNNFNDPKRCAFIIQVNTEKFEKL